MVGKPNQTIPKAPLQPIPAVQKPFSRIVVDCVGPLPKTRSANQLVFGHTVRGPLKLLKEKLLCSSSEPINYLQYVSDFRTKLFRGCKLATANLSTSQRSMKKKNMM